MEYDHTIYLVMVVFYSLVSRLNRELFEVYAGLLELARGLSVSGDQGDIYPKLRVVFHTLATPKVIYYTRYTCHIPNRI